MIYAIITEDGLDQICETKEQAMKEKIDLIELGCTVRLKTFANETLAYEYEEKHLR